MISALLKRYDSLLVLLALLCAVRLICFARQFSRDSLQMDFSGFYFAGAALNAGQDPYKNHVNEHPELWDGIGEYKHSRFLYPPIVAAAMRPLAALPFPTAKALWSFGSLALVAASVAVAVRMARLKLDRASAMFLVLTASLVFPILMFLDRGQMDAWTLLLIYLGFLLIFRKNSDFAGGAMLAVAAFLKLHCFFLLPLLLVARRPRAALAMAGAALAILLVQVLICGLPITRQYFAQELPRISRYGQEGTDDMRITSPFIQSVREKLGADETLAGGKWRCHITAMPGAIAVASVSLYARAVLSALHVPAPMSLISCAIFAVWLIVLWRFLPRAGIAGGWNSVAFASLCVVIILLSAPMTWVANLVWLVPLTVLMLFGPNVSTTDGRATDLVAAAAALGFLLLLIPDGHSFPLLLPGRAAGLHGGLTDKFFGALVRMHYPLALILLVPYLVKLASARPTDAASV